MSRLIVLAIVAAVLVQGAPSLPNFMGGFRPPNMGAMGAPGMGAMRPGMGAMGPPGLGGMGPPGLDGMGPPGLGGMGPPGLGGMRPPHMPPNMFRPPNFADAQASNSSAGSSFGFGWSLSNGLSAASLNAASDSEEQAAKIVKRDASSVFTNGFPFFPNVFHWTDGLKNGNGHYMSTSLVAHTGVDANGKPVTTGVQITDKDGKKTEKQF